MAFFVFSTLGGSTSSGFLMFLGLISKRIITTLRHFLISVKLKEISGASVLQGAIFRLARLSRVLQTRVCPGHRASRACLFPVRISFGQHTPQPALWHLESIGGKNWVIENEK
jgi:hypothetical protein